MGLQFGNLAKVSGVTTFRLSPYEQKPFVGFISEGFPNLLRRTSEIVSRGGVFFLMTYAIMVWATEENRKLHRKPQ